MDPILAYTYSYDISDQLGHGFLTQKIKRDPMRSLEVKRRSNLKNAPRDAIFGAHTLTISLSNIGYAILTSKFIRGHWRSKREGQKTKYT